VTDLPVKYEVGITYCDKTNFVHGHDSASQACAEYAQMLAEALYPTPAIAAARHVRMVSLIAFDDMNEVVHHITTPVFECRHTEVAGV
jgi:hypothetical protein